MDWFDLFVQIAERSVEDADAATKRRTRLFVAVVAIVSVLLGVIIFWGM